MKLADLPARVYACLYLLTIPTFAMIYTVVPNGFYHSTVKLEESYFDDRQALADMIKSKIAHDFVAHHGSQKMKFGQWEFDVRRDVWVDDFGFSNDLSDGELVDPEPLSAEAAARFPDFVRVSASQTTYAAKAASSSA